MNRQSARRAGFSIVCSGAVCLASLVFGGQPPNIVLILSDDAGYNEFGFNGSSRFLTPRLDALATRSVRCTHGYMSAPVCSPARAGLLTGRHQQRFGYERNISNGIDAADGMRTDEVLLFDRLQELGYAVGVVGKWHLGANDDLGQRPRDQGVDEFFGVLKGSRPYWGGTATGVASMMRDDRVVENEIDGQYVTDVFGDEAAAFIERHHADPSPFFLYLSFTAPHGPYQAREDDLALFPELSGTRRTIAAMVYAMDRAIGTVLDKLAEHGIDDETMVVFTNDNGGTPDNDNTPLRGVKGNTWEGGIRVPFLLKVPGVPGGADSDMPITALDVVPTLIRAAGGEMDPLFDGVDLMPYLTGEQPGVAERTLFWRSVGNWAVRRGAWKLVRPTSGAEYSLHDLTVDVGEANDLRRARPDIVAELLRELASWESHLDKPRWGTFGATDRNLFDRFLFRPEAGASVSGENQLVNPSFEEGEQSDDNSRYTFDEILAWTNSSGSPSEVAARPDEAHSGAYRGMLSSSRGPFQLSDHLLSPGEELALSFAHRGFSGWDDGADTVDVELVYADGAGDVQVLDSLRVDLTSGVWETVSHRFPPVSAPEAVGRPVGIRFRANCQGGEFASIDAVRLAQRSEEAETRLATWSAAGAWRNAEDGQVATLHSEDAYANASLEFRPLDAADYVATNDMQRRSGQEFMLNELDFSGSYGGALPRSARIEGNPLLFVRSLSGEDPRIVLGCLESGAGSYAFEVGLDAILHDDLVVDGDGTAAFRFSGSIRDFHVPRVLTKLGAAEMTLIGAATHGGRTSIHGGSLRLEGSDAALAGTAEVHVGPEGALVLAGGTIATGALRVGEGGRFEFLSGTLTVAEVIGDLTNAGGTFAAGAAGFVGSTAVTPLDGAYVQRRSATLALEIGGPEPGAEYDQLDVSEEVTLDGTLVVELVEGFVPAAGQRFTLLRCASLNGAFHSTRLPALPDDLDWQLEYLSQAVELRVTTTEGGPQRPGDCNQDGAVNISDAICVLGFLFLGAPSELPCGDGEVTDESNPRLLDWNGDGRLDTSDPVGQLAWLFLAGSGHALGAHCLTIPACPDACVAGG